MVAVLQASGLGLVASDHVPVAVADGSPVGLFVDVNGRAITAQKSSVGNAVSVTGTVADVVLLPANNARLGATIHNASPEVLYVLLANTTCTPDVYTTSIYADGYYELPYGYVGVVHGTWYAPNSGHARVTELT
jgi:hypothetical protein